MKCTELLLSPYFVSSYQRTIAESPYRLLNQTWIINNFVINKPLNLSYTFLFTFTLVHLVIQLIIYTTRNADLCGKQVSAYCHTGPCFWWRHNFIFLNYLWDFVFFCKRRKEVNLLLVAITKLWRASLSKQECLMCRELDGCDLILLCKLLESWFWMTDQSISLVLHTLNVCTRHKLSKRIQNMKAYENKAKEPFDLSADN